MLVLADGCRGGKSTRLRERPLWENLRNSLALMKFISGVFSLGRKSLLIFQMNLGLFIYIYVEEIVYIFLLSFLFIKLLKGSSVSLP